MSEPTAPQPIRSFIPREVYEAFERKLPQPMLRPSDKGENAAFLLGVQYTLRQLREELVR